MQYYISKTETIWALCQAMMSCALSYIGTVIDISDSSYVSTGTWHCKGFKSCYQTTFANFSRLISSGFLALQDSTIHMGSSIELKGYLTGYNATIICHSRYCQIFCYETGCIGTHFKCDNRYPNCQFMFHGDSDTCETVILNNQTNPTQDNEYLIDICANQTLSNHILPSLYINHQKEIMDLNCT